MLWFTEFVVLQLKCDPVAAGVYQRRKDSASFQLDVQGKAVWYTTTLLVTIFYQLVCFGWCKLVHFIEASSFQHMFVIIGETLFNGTKSPFLFNAMILLFYFKSYLVYGHVMSFC